MSVRDPAGSCRLVHADHHDAHPVGRRADAAALVATDLTRCADRRAARQTHLTGRFTEELDATATKRSANAAAFVTAILAHSTEAGTTRLTGGLLRRAVLVGAYLSKTDALTAALVAAKLAGTTHHLIARLADTKVLGAWDVIGNADAAALWATGRTLDAENRRARVVIDWHANAGAVSTASGGITAIARIVDANEPVGAR